MSDYFKKYMIFVAYNALLIMTIGFSNNLMYGMENTIQEAPSLWLPNELIARIAGSCQPHEKNKLMKVCKAFNACLKNRELILHTNPITVSLSDKIRSVFKYISSGDAKNLSTWLDELKKAEGNVDCKNILGMTPLHYAQEKKNENIIRLLIKYGANTNNPKPEIHPLHKAIYEGDTEAVNRLLSYASRNLFLHNETTPLHIATYEGHTEVVHLLIKAEASIIKNRYKETPLHIAARHGHVDIIQLLINTRSYPKYYEFGYQNKRGESPLRIAAKNGHIDVVQFLLDVEGYCVWDHNEVGRSLWMALQNGHVDVVKALLCADAKSHKESYSGNGIYSPLASQDIRVNRPHNLLDAPAQDGNIKTAKLLLYFGADANQQSDDKTPLHIAASKGYIEIVKLLLCAGADVELETKRHYHESGLKGEHTAFQIAQHNNHHDIAELLHNHWLLIRKKRLEEEEKNACCIQ